MPKEPVEPNPEVEAAMDVILRALNVMGSQHKAAVAEAVVQKLQREHRTIQQSFWSMMMKVQMRYADFDSDLRNQEAVKMAGAVKQLAKDNNWDMGLPEY